MPLALRGYGGRGPAASVNDESGSSFRNNPTKKRIKSDRLTRALPPPCTVFARSFRQEPLGVNCFNQGKPDVTCCALQARLRRCRIGAARLEKKRRLLRRWKSTRLSENQ